MSEITSLTTFGAESKVQEEHLEQGMFRYFRRYMI